MAEKERKLPASSTSPETEEYWAAAKEGKLLVKKCNGCGKTHHYPRSLCPYCFSDKTVWTTASGKGVIYSYSVMRRAPIPYALAYVTLAEGTTMMTNMVDCDFDKLKCGQPVKVVFKPTDGGGALACFTPA
ncbi:MAG: Zn-ribbon domain-containing OB-fold protein [Alphaproteobacteria bacterium]|nr:Zn-ribbon domain-containing OB-fold protein [Alphaproteobacteria bacterium]